MCATSVKNPTFGQNSMNLKNSAFFIVFFAFVSGFAQEQQPEGGRQINIVYGANFTKDEAQFPGASIFSKDDERQVQFEHQGADLGAISPFFMRKKTG